jgi:hypothetical protein
MKEYRNWWLEKMQRMDDNKVSELIILFFIKRKTIYCSTKKRMEAEAGREIFPMP